MNVSRRWPGLAVAAALALPATAPAADLPLWELGVGLGALSLPHYRGSARNNSWLLPVPYAVYRGEVLRANRDGVKAMLLDSERVDFDLSLAATAPSRSADEPARAGMPDLDGTLEFGPNLNLRLARGPGWKLELRLPLRAAVTLDTRPEFIGWAASPNLNIDHRVGAWNLGAQVGALWGSRRLHGYFYDVDPAYATASRPSYRARGGFEGWQATAGVSRRDGNRWLGAFVRADSLAGSVVADSPLVQRRQHATFGVAVSWVLWQSTQRVPDRDELP